MWPAVLMEGGVKGGGGTLNYSVLLASWGIVRPKDREVIVIEKIVIDSSQEEGVCQATGEGGHRGK